MELASPGGSAPPAAAPTSVIGQTVEEGDAATQGAHGRMYAFVRELFVLAIPYTLQRLYVYCTDCRD